ncbi:hypothetical protein MMC26_007317 [Xylographa opegraphella]|nr:hypothetical protein [Xylographa opegraphella]
MAESAEHFIDSLYTFNAPDELIESFKATEDSNKCQTIEYKDGQFHLTCLRSDSDQILTTFLVIYSGYVETESLVRPADAFELPKLNRRNDTVIYEDPAAIYEQEDAYSDGTGESARIRNTMDDEMTLISHENITRVYKHSDSLDMKILKQLEGLTKCTTEVHDERKEILVKGDTLENVEKMCAKLSVVDQANSRFTTQRPHDFYNIENEAKFRFHFYRVEKLIDRHIQADNPAFYFEYLELMLVKYVEGEWKPHTAPRNLIEARETSVHPWNDYIYPALGNEAISDIEFENDSGAVHGYLAPDKVLSLTSWTEKVPVRPANAFEAVPAGDVSSSEVTPMVPPSRKNYVKSKRVVKGQPDVALENFMIGFEPLPEPPPIEPPHMPMVADVRDERTTGSPNIASSPKEAIPKAITYCKQGSLIDHPEPITYVSAKASQADSIPYRANAQYEINQKDRDVLRDHTNFVELRASKTEKLQETSEAQTRNYRRAHNLKASKTTVPISMGPSLASRITEAMSTILEMARTGYGRLKFDVALGCIYVKGTHLAREIQTGPFAEADWPVAFQTRSGSGRAQTLFSSTLTTSWVDANFLIDLKLKDNTRVFSKAPAEVRVTYLVKCVNKHQNNNIVIEIEPDGKHEYYHSPRTIGSVNCFFPKRVWDTAFGVTEFSVATIDPQDPIKALVDNFWVRSGPRITLGGQIPGREIGIASIQVRRQTSHQSTANPDLFLRLTEVQDLIVQQHSPQYFRAYAALKDQMIDDDNRVWWEASISSKVADNTLLENHHLELGEIAQWASDEIIGMSIVEDMFQLAEQVVTRIDSVGYGTKSFSAPQQPAGTARSATKSTVTGKKDRFADVWAEW